MNRQHLQAFLWLRWRLFINQLRRGGIANIVVLTLLAIGGVLLSLGMFVGFFLVGLFTLAEVSPTVLLYVWDGLVVAFLFSWAMGLLMQLQRSEVLSLEKFLHLPVSLRGIFLINYLSSFFNLTLLALLPGMTALSLALVIVRGTRMLLLFPLLAGFILMVTAVTYQVQGWLAALMVNPRRRRTVIVVATMFFILICQLPNLVNLLHPWQHHSSGKSGVEIDTQETERVAWLINAALPPGWLPLGAMSAAEGNLLAALLATLGMTLIGSASLWRAYRTTVRLYTGHYNSAKRVPVAVVAAPVKTGKPTVSLLERRLPWASEQVSVIALGGFRSLFRAPEAKMMLLSPLLMIVVFGSIFFVQSVTPPESVRPTLSFAGMAMILLSMGQFVGNQFGFDRGGFRVFVLSAVPRRHILLGKNLACAPFALGMGAVVLIALQVLVPVRFDHFLAVIPQSISMFLLFCMMANWLSIFAPLRLRAGSSQPANLRGLPLLLQFAFVFLYPAVLSPLLLPWGVEFALAELTGITHWPIYLVLSLLICVVVVCLYRAILTWQGGILQAREQRILEIVTTKTE